MLVPVPQVATAHHSLSCAQYPNQRDFIFLEMSGTNEIEVLADSQVTILSERRRHAAWGVPADREEAGTNLCIERRSARLLPDKITFHAHAGDGVERDAGRRGLWPRG